MPYAQRDSQGHIVALFEHPRPGAEEMVSASSDEVLSFLLSDQQEEEVRDFLSRTDTEMVRIVEDLVDLLIDKHLILLTDLPEAAQKKLLSRKRLRASFSDEPSLLIDEQSIL